MNTACPICTPGGLGAVCDACLAVAPMRRVAFGQCVECSHEWIAPTIGRCPRCGGQAMKTFERTNGLKRV